MRVRVRLYGGLAERAGRREEALEFEGDATAADVLDALVLRHPAVEAIVPHLQVAVNMEVVPAEHRIRPEDVVALLPPVAGGRGRLVVGLRARPTLEEALDAVAGPEAGGTASFVGTVRAEGGRVDRLEYSAYEEMAERVLRDIGEEAAQKWPLAGVAVFHAVGDLAPGERTMVVACSAAHRDEAFEACRYVVDEVKRRVPIWKKEVGPGGHRWIGLDP